MQFVSSAIDFVIIENSMVFNILFVKFGQCFKSAIQESTQSLMFSTIHFFAFSQRLQICESPKAPYQGSIHIFETFPDEGEKNEKLIP